MARWNTRVILMCIPLLLFGLSAPANATDPLPPFASGQAEGPDGEDTPGPGRSTVAHKGKPKDIQKDGWGTATICAEVQRQQYKCYDTQADYDADMGRTSGDPAKDSSPSGGGRQQRADNADSLGEIAPMASPYRLTFQNCPYTWVCLYEHSNYSGRRLQWQQSGTNDLSTWNFRDQATGLVNNRQGGLTIVDFKSYSLDPTRYFCNLCTWYVSNLTGYSHPDGNWNDRIDRIIIE